MFLKDGCVLCKMNFKKIIGFCGILIAVALLAFAGLRFISWLHFWAGMILLGAFAYFVLPRIES